MKEWLHTKFEFPMRNSLPDAPFWHEHRIAYCYGQTAARVDKKIYIPYRPSLSDRFRILLGSPVIVVKDEAGAVEKCCTEW